MGATGETPWVQPMTEGGVAAHDALLMGLPWQEQPGLRVRGRWHRGGRGAPQHLPHH